MKSMAGPSGLVTYYLIRTLCKFCFSREREREREVCSNSCCQKMIVRQSVWKLNESVLGGLSYMEGNTWGVWHSSNEQVSKADGRLFWEHRTRRDNLRQIGLSVNTGGWNFSFTNRVKSVFMNENFHSPMLPLNSLHCFS